MSLTHSPAARAAGQALTRTADQKWNIGSVTRHPSGVRWLCKRAGSLTCSDAAESHLRYADNLAI